MVTDRRDARYYDIDCFDPYYNFCGVTAWDDVTLASDRTLTVSTGNTNSDIDACGTWCQGLGDCVSVSYASGTCRAYTQKVQDFTVPASSDSRKYWNIGCFDPYYYSCDGVPGAGDSEGVTSEDSLSLADCQNSCVNDGSCLSFAYEEALPTPQCWKFSKVVRDISIQSGSTRTYYDAECYRTTCNAQGWEYETFFPWVAPSFEACRDDCKNYPGSCTSFSFTNYICRQYTTKVSSYLIISPNNPITKTYDDIACF